MYSICIKFKPELNWRPQCRQFETEDECHAYVNEAFDKWKVHHVCVFKDGLFLRCFYMSPRQCAAIREAVYKMHYNQRRLYGNYINR